MPILPVAASAFSGGSGVVSSPDLQRINTCIVKKDLSCIPREVQHLAMDRELYLKSNLFHYQIWAYKNLEQIQSFISQIKDLQPCLNQFRNQAPTLAWGYMNYFNNYLRDVKSDIKRIEALNAYATGELDREETVFIVSKLKNDFEKFKKNLEKTEKEFKEIIDRKFVVGMAGSLNKFERAALRFGSGKCNVKDIKPITITPLQLSNPAQ